MPCSFSYSCLLRPASLLYRSLTAIRAVSGPLRRYSDVDALRSLDGRGIGDTGEGEGRGELHDVLLELGNELGGLAGAGLEGGGEVLKELGASLLLGDEGDLDDSVQELGDLLDVGLNHRSGREGGSTDSDTTGHKGGGCLLARFIHK